MIETERINEFINDTSDVYNCNEKTRFDEICTIYGLTKINDDAYEIRDMNLVIAVHDNKILALEKDKNCFSRHLYSHLLFYEKRYYEKIGYYTWDRYVSIHHLKGLMYFLDVIGLYRIYKNGDFEQIPLECEKFKTKILK